jgi:aryl-alcohol dehydrogenase-like predicted oxidoreductase
MNKLVIGTANFGLQYGINNSEGKLKSNKIKQLLLYANKNGIENIDTANAYNNAEETIGDIISNKMNFNITTKISGYTAGMMATEIAESFVNLKVKKIYGLLHHNFNNFKKCSKINKDFFLSYKDKYYCEKIGFSIYKPSELEWLFENNINFDIIQIPYSVFDRRFEQYFEKLKSRNIEIQARSIYLQGLAFKNPNDLSNHFNNAKKQLENLCYYTNKKYTISDLCLGFLMMNKYIDKIVTGIDNIEQLKKNIEISNKYKYDTELEKDFNIKYNLDYYNIFEIKDEDILIPSRWPK